MDTTPQQDAQDQPEGQAAADQQQQQQEQQPQQGGGGGRLGDVLTERGFISEDQLKVALREKKRSPDKMLGEILVEFGFITEHALQAVLAESAGRTQLDLKTSLVDTELVQRLPKDVAQRYRILPISMNEEDNELRVAMADIYDVVALDQLRRYFPPTVEITTLAVTETDLLEAIDQYYGYEMSIDGLLQEIETGEVDTSTMSLTEGGYVNPTVRLVNAIILDAVKQGASDIHFEPEGPILRLRYRMDGVLHQIRTLHIDYWPAMVVRLKIMSGMNIAETRNPQDGRISMNLGSREVDFRVASHPTIHGENVVIRILDKSRSLVPLDKLGFSQHNLELMRKMLKAPEGIIVVTGPTGSGKTTTLYSVLNYVNSPETNIMTLEEPVEYQLPLIRQSDVKESAGMNFGEGIRSILRQDPDVVFVGEIRDEDTAVMALRAAMTGHQMFSTLHTNDALGAVPRLIDLGMPAHMLAGQMVCAVAQRLARTLCPSCRAPRYPDAEECKVLNVDPDDPPQINGPVGCDDCRHTGYRGRAALIEILPFDEEIGDLIATGATRKQLKDHALKSGFHPMADDGIEKVLDGRLTLESLGKVVNLTDRY